jgi:hypothetical protein
MTHEEQLLLVKQHYALNFAGNHVAAHELLTDDFESQSCTSCLLEELIGVKMRFSN